MFDGGCESFNEWIIPDSGFKFELVEPFAADIWLIFFEAL